MVEITEQTSANIWIFCYGSNGPKQICKRIGTPYDQIIDKMVPVKLYGYQRHFQNDYNKPCNDSAATLYSTSDNADMVEGIAVNFTEAEVLAMDPFEGVPEWYVR